MRNTYWIDSGLAAEAARDLIWFVVLVFVGVAVVIWRDIRKNK
jgi:hypothetical protein